MSYFFIRIALCPTASVFFQTLTMETEQNDCFYKLAKENYSRLVMDTRSNREGAATHTRREVLIHFVRHVDKKPWGCDVFIAKDSHERDCVVTMYQCEIAKRYILQFAPCTLTCVAEDLRPLKTPEEGNEVPAYYVRCIKARVKPLGCDKELEMELYT